MLKIRYNFETNSSSMHSLSYRRVEGPYTEEELTHSEAMVGERTYDAIFTMKDGATVNANHYNNKWWIRDGRARLWSSELDFGASPMEILSSFKDKLRYAISTVLGYKYRGWGNRYNAIVDVFKKIYPDVQLEVSCGNIENCYFSSPTDYLLYKFLKDNKVTIEEFLINPKYIVIIDYPEYLKMKWLDMVDESMVESIYIRDDIEDTAHAINIVDGVWKLEESDLSFGRSPFRVLGTPEGKARYALAVHNTSNLDDVLVVMQKIYPEMKSIELPKDEYEEDGICRGYCDDNAMPTDISLEEFILNKKYVIIADGDEYCAWSDFKKTPLFNKNSYLEDSRDDEKDGN